MILIRVTDPNARICRKSRKLPKDMIGFGLTAVIDLNLVTSTSACGRSPRKETTNGIVLRTEQFNFVFCDSFEDALGGYKRWCTIRGIRGPLSGARRVLLNLNIKQDITRRLSGDFKEAPA